MQAFHPDERDADVKHAGNDGHQHIVQMVSGTYQVAGDTCLHRVPAEQQRGKQAGREHIALAAKYDAGDEREIHALFRAQGAQCPDISEHDQVADDHGDQRALKAHAEHEHRSRHRAGDDHREADPDHRDREQAPPRLRRHRFVLVFFTEHVIYLINLGFCDCSDGGMLSTICIRHTLPPLAHYAENKKSPRASKRRCRGHLCRRSRASLPETVAIMTDLFQNTSTWLFRSCS